MKAVAAALGVARSNLVEQLQRPKRPQRGPYRRAEDEAVLGEIRAITDARPTYGYRRVTALLNRARRNAGAPQINHKRVFRLMRLSSMLLQPHTGRRAIRAHEGRVVAAACRGAVRGVPDPKTRAPSCAPPLPRWPRASSRSLSAFAGGCPLRCALCPR